MKELNEEQMMRIFDLLEGNLSPEEAEKVKNEIRADEYLRQEYELLSKTYLDAEPIEYSRKASLKKGGMIWFIHPRTLSVAATLLLLTGAFFVFHPDGNTDIHRGEIAGQGKMRNSVNSKIHAADTSSESGPSVPVFMASAGAQTGNRSAGKSNAVNPSHPNPAADSISRTEIPVQHHSENFEMIAVAGRNATALPTRGRVRVYDNRAYVLAAAEETPLRSIFARMTGAVGKWISKPSLKLRKTEDGNHYLLALSNEKFTLEARVK